MKYLLTVLLIFLVWKIHGDWQRIQAIKSKRAARDSALSEFEQLTFHLEMKMENGELTREEFQRLRQDAMRRLQEKIHS